MRDEDGLTALMYAETDAAPPARIDLARVISDGKRRRRRRMLLAPAVAAVTVIAVAAGAVVSGGLQRTSVPTPPASAAPSPSMAALEPAPAVFDPLRLRVGAGWVPDGLIAQPPQLGQLAQRIWFSELQPRGGNPVGRWVDVIMYAAGVRPWQLTDVPPTYRPSAVDVSPVAGRPAQRLVYDLPGYYTDALAWRWASDAWAVVRVGYYPDTRNQERPEPIDESEQQAIERRIAESVRTIDDRPVRLPFTMATPPDPLRLVEVDIGESGSAFDARLRFRIRDQVSVTGPIATQGDLEDYYDTVVVTVSRPLPDDRRKPEPDRIIGGHPAAVMGFLPDGPDGSVDLYDVQGYDINVWVFAEGRTLITKQVAIDLALSVAILGPPTDRSSWTDRPLR